jgi:hypothetical protein
MRGAPVIVAIAVVLAISGDSRADELDEQLLEFDAAPGKVGPTMSQMLADRLTLLGREMDSALGALSMDRFTIRLDGRARKAYLRLGKGDGETYLRLDSNMHFRSGVARIATQIEVSVVGRKLKLELPAFDLVPRSYGGERYVEVRIPILHGAFEPEKWLGKLVGH